SNNHPFVVIDAQSPKEAEKVVVVGSKGVGKTSLVRRLVCDSFTDEYETTKGIDVVKTTLCGDKDFVQFGLWDTPGVEATESFVQRYGQSTKCIIVVVDNTKESWVAGKKWIEAIQRCKERTPLKEKSPDVVVVETKIDLEQKGEKEGYDAELKMNGIELIKVSSKSGNNIPGLIGHIVKDKNNKQMKVEEQQVCDFWIEPEEKSRACFSWFNCRITDF
ncbi:GTP-binding protein ryH1, putative, partial [Entamoeba invadens IP1]